MIHGGQGDQTMFNDIAASFANNFRVLTFDQRGSGLSEKPDMEYSIAMLADDTVLAIEFEPQTRHDAMPQARSQNMFRDTGFAIRQQGLFSMLRERTSGASRLFFGLGADSGDT